MSQVAYLVLNSVVVYPTTRKILQARDRVPSLTHRKILAALFLAFVGILSMSYEISQMFGSKNAFRIIGVSRAATDSEIRKAYKIAALELHPDRNIDDPNAEEKFLEFKEAYDKLLNAEFRDAYDRWGDSGTEWQEKNQDMSFLGGVQVLISYVIFAAVTFIITLTSSDTNARVICLSGLMLLAGIEGQLRFQGTDFTMPFFNWLALHQMIQLMHRSYYTFVTGTIAFQNLTYFDPNSVTMEILKKLILQNNEIQQRLLELDQELRITGKQGGFSKKVAGVNALGSSTANIEVNGAPNAMDGKNMPRNLQARKRLNQGPPPRGRSKIPSWAIMVGIYIFFNYVMK
mmetsp:Transcript_4832/g.5635  ORF Transcript_4832/g.5635 Transcript_4832/m.5635 type:complete len:345 (-) Transcript_4832:1212-2246(-)